MLGLWNRRLGAFLLAFVPSYMWMTTLPPRPWMRGLIAWVRSIVPSYPLLGVGSSGPFGSQFRPCIVNIRICHRSFRRRTLASHVQHISSTRL
ncbi:hypothetical protein F5148DRAFT_821463 [Russula earlei]|uniref:Uncharacterized protein n=1 Tax=Russula earlei TaxID=71964 RepID=A0ACC0TSD5_9AGAM|nr:hypothetical protein F5148DRAFT_821463 [Russula earlei]